MAIPETVQQLNISNCLNKLSCTYQVINGSGSGFSEIEHCTVVFSVSLSGSQKQGVFQLLKAIHTQESGEDWAGFLAVKRKCQYFRWKLFLFQNVLVLYS